MRLYQISISSHLLPHSLVSNKGIVCHTMVIVIKNSNTPHPRRRRKTNCTIMHIEIGQLNLYQHSLSSLNLPQCKYKNETLFVIHPHILILLHQLFDQSKRPIADAIKKWMLLWPSSSWSKQTLLTQSAGENTYCMIMHLIWKII